MEYSGAPRILHKPPGPKARRILEIDGTMISPSVTKHVPIVWCEGKGAIIKDVDGNLYIDFSSGILVANTGHCHPRVVEAVRTQAGRLLNCYDAPSDVRSKLFEKLKEIMPDGLNTVLFCSSGAEAIEAGVRLAKRYTNRHEIISFFGGFHGRTHLTASLTSMLHYKRKFGPAAPGIIHAPYPYCYRCPFGLKCPDCGLHCVDYLENVLEFQSVGDVAALVVEPIQGAGGTIVPPDDYFKGLRKFCDEHNILFIDDEVQTSYGRTGKFYAIEHWAVKPDMMCVGKGMASGVPISAVFAPASIMSCWSAGEQSSTFGGNPLSCSAAIATIEVMQEEKLSDNAARVGAHMMRRIKKMEMNHTLIGDVRGKGLTIGVELVKDKTTKKPAVDETTRVALRAFENGLLVYGGGGVYGNVLRITPPLVLTEALADKGLEILNQALTEVERTI
jgi:4-aminobutyrate aminotransferase